MSKTPRAHCDECGTLYSPDPTDGGTICVRCLKEKLTALRSENERLVRERDLALAHDTQPYPTADAYEKVCAARTFWQERADAARSLAGRLTEDREAMVELYNKAAMDANRAESALAAERENATKMLALVVLSAGGSVWVTGHAARIGADLTREDHDGYIHFTAIVRRRNRRQAI